MEVALMGTLLHPFERTSRVHVTSLVTWLTNLGCVPQVGLGAAVQVISGGRRTFL